MYCIDCFCFSWLWCYKQIFDLIIIEVFWSSFIGYTFRHNLGKCWFSVSSYSFKVMEEGQCTISLKWNNFSWKWKVLEWMPLRHRGVVTILGAIGIKEDVRRCRRMPACALISRDAADTSRIPAAAVVCCTSQLISDARLQRSTRLSATCGRPLTHR